MSLFNLVDNVKYKISELGLGTINVDNPNLIVIVDRCMYILFTEQAIMTCLHADLSRVCYYQPTLEGVKLLKQDIVSCNFHADSAANNSEFETAIMNTNVNILPDKSVKLYDLIKEFGDLDQIPRTKYEIEEDPLLIDPVIIHDKKEYAKIRLDDRVVETCTYTTRDIHGTFRRNYERVIDRTSGEVLSNKTFDVRLAIDGLPVLNNMEKVDTFRANYAKMMEDLDPEITISDISDTCINSSKRCMVASKRLVNRSVIIAFDNYDYLYVRITESPKELDDALKEDEKSWYRFRINHMVIYSATKFVSGGPFVTDWVVTTDDDCKLIELLDANRVGGKSHSLEYDFCEYGLKSMFLRKDLTIQDIEEQIKNSNFTMLVNKQRETTDPKPFFEKEYYDFPVGYKPVGTQSILDLNHIYSPYLKTNMSQNTSNSSNIINSGGFTMNNLSPNMSGQTQDTQMPYYVPFESQIQNYDPSKITLATRDSFEQVPQATQQPVVVEEAKQEPINSNGQVSIIINKEPQNYIDGDMPRTESGVIDFSALTTGRPLDQVLNDDNNNLQNNPEYVEGQQSKQRTVTQSIEVIKNFAAKNMNQEKVVANFQHLADPEYQAEQIQHPKLDNPSYRQTLINEAAFYGGPAVDPFSVTVDDLPIIKRYFENEEKQSRELLSKIKVLDRDGNDMGRDTFQIWNTWLLQNGMHPEDLVPDYNGDTHVSGQQNLNMNVTRPDYTSQGSNSFLLNQHMAQKQKQAELEEQYLSDKSEEQIQQFKEEKEQFEIADFSDLYREKQNINSREIVKDEEPTDTTIEAIESSSIEEGEFEYVLDEGALKNNIEYKTHMKAIEKLEKEIEEKGKTTVRKRKLNSHIKYIEILKKNHMVKVPKVKEQETNEEIDDVEKDHIVSAEYVVNFVKQILNNKGIIPTEEEWNSIMEILQVDYDKDMIAEYLISKVAEDFPDELYLDVLENGTHVDGEMVYARDKILTDVFGLDLYSINETVDYNENTVAQDAIDYIRSILTLHNVTDILTTDDEICDMILKPNGEEEAMNYIIHIYNNCVDENDKRMLGFIITNRKMSIANIIYNRDAIVQTIHQVIDQRKSVSVSNSELLITPEQCLANASSQVPNINKEEFLEFINKQVTEDYAFKRFGQILRALPKQEAAKYKSLRNHNRFQEVKWLVLTDDFIRSEIGR